MKKILTLSMMIVALGACFNVYSSVYFATGKIKSIIMVDESIAVEGPSFLISGLAKAGSCHVGDSGLVPILIKNDDNGKEQYSMAFSSYMSDVKVKIKVDDSMHDGNNYCYLSWIGLDKSNN